MGVRKARACQCSSPRMVLGTKIARMVATAAPPFSRMCCLFCVSARQQSTGRRIMCSEHAVDLIALVYYRTKTAFCGLTGALTRARTLSPHARSRAACMSALHSLEMRTYER